MYCEKCGWVGGVLFGKKCSFCSTKMKILPKEMKQKYNIFNNNWSELYSKLHMLNTIDETNRIIEELLSRRNNFIINEVANNPLFSIGEYNNKQIGEQQAKNLAQMQKEKDKQNCIPKCPICGSTNVNKISIGSRAVKTAVFGAVGAVDDTGKTYKCGNCGSRF